MVPRKLVGSLLMLLAVQYAALGGAPLCADLSSGTASSIAQGPIHGEHATHDTGAPCPPAPQDSRSHHSTTPGCLAMTGCAAAGIAVPVALQLVTPRIIAGHVASSPAPLASVFATPETPPPITV